MGIFKENFFHEDIENMSEEIVFEKLHTIIEKNEVDFCKCKVCIQDIAAIVLNRVPPIYCCNYTDKLFPDGILKLKAEAVEKQVEKEIYKAIDMVKETTHHER